MFVSMSVLVLIDIPHLVSSPRTTLVFILDFSPPQQGFSDFLDLLERIFMVIKPRRAPVRPIRRKGMQIEFTQANCWLRSPDYWRKAKPGKLIFHLVTGQNSICINVIHSIVGS